MSDLPPHDLDAEQSVLGAMLVSPNAITVVAGMLTAEDFYREAHRTVYRAVIALSDKGEEVDIVTLGAELQRERALERVGGREFVHTLAEFVPAATNAAHYAGIVRATSIRRRVIRIAQEMSDTAYRSASPEDALEAAESALHALEGSEGPDGPTALRELLFTATDRIDEAKSGVRKLGITTHLADLNALVTAIGPGTFSILGARPGEGKTALACDILRHVAKDERCVLFSLEMSKEDIVDRLLSSEAVVGLTNIRSGDVDPAAVGRIGGAVSRMGTWRLYIDDSATTVYGVHRAVRRLMRHAPLGLVVVDYIQLMTSGRDRHDTREQEVATISRRLKLMAREFNVPVLGLSQLSRPERKYDSQGNRQSNPQKPTLQSLRESGALEQDADLVMFLWRPQSEDATRVELLVEKNRCGPVGRVQLLFVPHLVTFKGRT